MFSLYLIFVRIIIYLISVSGTPTSLSYTKQGPASAEVMWVAPLDKSVTSGFEVFYESSNGETLSEEIGIGAFQEVTLFLSLQPDQNYTVFVVAYGTYLPSERSNTITIPQGQLKSCIIGRFLLLIYYSLLLCNIKYKGI